MVESLSDTEMTSLPSQRSAKQDVGKVSIKGQSGEQHDRMTKSRTTTVDLSQEPAIGIGQRWASGIHTVRVYVCRGIRVISRWSASHPWTTIVSTVVLSLGMVVLGLFTNFYVETDGGVLWPPHGSTTYKHQQWIVSKSNFSEELYFSILYIHRGGENLVAARQAKRSLEKVFEVYETITNIQDDNGIPGYDAICAEPYTDPTTNITTSCDAFGLIEFWGSNYSAFHNSVGNDQEAIEQISATHFPNGKKVDPSRIYGGAVYDNSTKLLTRVDAYSLVLVYPIWNDANEFLQQVIDVVAGLSDGTYQVEVNTGRSFDDGFHETIVKDIPLMPFAFIVMSAFCCIVFARCDRVKSQSLVGVGAVTTVLCSIFTGYGLMFLLGIPLSSATQVIVFVMFGIGLDDAFIISESYQRTDPNKSPVERIDDTINDIGLSITITSLTSALAFATGCISSVSGVFWMCLYAFPTILLDFLYQISMFVAIIVIDERRKQRGNMDCLVCIKISPDDLEDDLGDGLNVTSDNIENKRNAGENEPSSGRKSSRFMDAYADILLHPGVKAALLSAFTALFSACVWGATQLRQELDFLDMMPTDHYLHGFFDVKDKYFVDSGFECAVYFRFSDQSDPAIRAEMDDYINDLHHQGAIISQPAFFWVRDFQKFVDSGNATGAGNFNDQLDAFMADPLYNMLYKDYIVRDPVTRDIISSKVQLYMDIDMSDSKQLVDRLDLLRDIAASTPSNKDLKEVDYRFFFYDGTMNMWEFYAVVPQELTFTTITSIVSVSVIGLCLIPHWTAMFFLVPSIVTVYMDLLGFLYFLGVTINPVSYIVLVMSIGLLVDFIVHPLVRYYECFGSREERVRETLRTMGFSILLGGLSTFLGIMMLAFSTSHIFTVLFRAFIAMVVLSCSYGLILLPVVLSLLGPEDDYGRQLPPSEPSSEVEDIHRSNVDGTDSEALAEFTNTTYWAAGKPKEIGRVVYDDEISC